MSPISEPTFLNVEFIFQKIFGIFEPIFRFFISLLSNDPSLRTDIGYGVKTLLNVTALIAIIVIIYTIVRLTEIRNKENQEARDKHFAYNTEEQGLTNSRWQQILDHIASENKAEWRMAVMDSDSMLEEYMMNDLRFEGLSLGERLNFVANNESLGFVSIKKAQEAHGVRNQVAHQGSSFNLSNRETTRVVGLFEEVFKELGVI
jgi:hypothetical protein